MIIVLKMVVLVFSGGPRLGKLPTYSQQFWANSTRPSKHLGLKVRTFFDGPGNGDFEMTLFLILVASIFAEKKLKQYANFIISQLIQKIAANTYKFSSKQFMSAHGFNNCFYKCFINVKSHFPPIFYGFQHYCSGNTHPTFFEKVISTASFRLQKHFFAISWR